MPVIAFTIAATVLAALCIPVALMLAPKGGLSASVSEGLVTAGTTSVERRLQQALVVFAVAACLCMLAVRLLG